MNDGWLAGWPAWKGAEMSFPEFDHSSRELLCIYKYMFIYIYVPSQFGATLLLTD